MRIELVNLGRNLAAGLRLALFAPVSRLAFRIDVAQVLLLFAVSALVDFGADWVRYGPDAYFSWFGAGNELFAAGLMMLSVAVLALILRQGALLVAIPVLALGAYPVLQVALTLPAALERWAGAKLPPWLPLEGLVLAWAVAVLVRCVAVALPPARWHRWPRALAGGLVLAAPIWISPMLLPTEAWWRQPSAHGGADPRYPSPASEAVLTTQQDLLDDALAGIEDERPGVTDLYFVGFAGDAHEDVFRKDVEAAQRVMDERWDTAGRSVALINNPRTLLEAPIATVSNLRATLNEIGAVINRDEDVVMVYLASHGRQNPELEISLPPLELAQLSPVVLRKLLDDAGIRWRIIVISACYSGGFIKALEDEQTLVLTAAQSDRTSFGCGHRSDATYFGEALFEHGLVKSDSILGAFELAKRRITEREVAGGHKPPSNPQASVGAAMPDKLRELERGRATRRAGNTV
jgi:hypothetical protein